MNRARFFLVIMILLQGCAAPGDTIAMNGRFAWINSDPAYARAFSDDERFCSIAAQEIIDASHVCRPRSPQNCKLNSDELTKAMCQYGNQVAGNSCGPSRVQLKPQEIQAGCLAAKGWKSSWVDIDN